MISILNPFVLLDFSYQNLISTNSTQTEPNSTNLNHNQQHRPDQQATPFWKILAGQPGHQTSQAIKPGQAGQQPCHSVHMGTITTQWPDAQTLATVGRFSSTLTWILRECGNRSGHRCGPPGWLSRLAASAASFADPGKANQRCSQRELHAKPFSHTANNSHVVAQLP